MDMKNIVERIHLTMEERGISEKHLSMLAAGHGDLIRNWRRKLDDGVTEFGANADSLRRVAEQLGVTYAWLTTGEEFNGPSRVETYEAPPNGYLTLSVFDLKVAAGHNGGIARDYDDAVYKLAFPPDYLKHIAPGTDIRFLQILPVHGHSMSPTLNNNDIVMVDTSRRDLSWEGLFVINRGGAYYVKRIGQSEDPAKVRIISDNSNKEYYPTLELLKVDVEVVGRVRWYGAKAVE